MIKEKKFVSLLMLTISKCIVANNTDNNNNNNNEFDCCGICSGFNTPETKKDTDKDTDKKQLPTPPINNVDPIQTNSPQQQYQFPDITNIYDENIPAIQNDNSSTYPNIDKENIQDQKQEIYQDNQNHCIEEKISREKYQEMSEANIEDNNQNKSEIGRNIEENKDQVERKEENNDGEEEGEEGVTDEENKYNQN